MERSNHHTSSNEGRIMDNTARYYESVCYICLVLAGSYYDGKKISSSQVLPIISPEDACVSFHPVRPLTSTFSLFLPFFEGAQSKESINRRRATSGLSSKQMLFQSHRHTTAAARGRTRERSHLKALNITS